MFRHDRRVWVVFRIFCAHIWAFGFSTFDSLFVVFTEAILLDCYCRYVCERKSISSYRFVCWAWDSVQRRSQALRNIFRTLRFKLVMYAEYLGVAHFATDQINARHIICENLEFQRWFSVQTWNKWFVLTIKFCEPYLKFRDSKKFTEPSIRLSQSIDTWTQTLYQVRFSKLPSSPLNHQRKNLCRTVEKKKKRWKINILKKY